MSGALKMREWKMQEWKRQEWIARVEIAGVENTGAKTYGKRYIIWHVSSRSGEISCNLLYIRLLCFTLHARILDAHGAADRLSFHFHLV